MNIYIYIYIYDVELYQHLLVVSLSGTCPVGVESVGIWLKQKVRLRLYLHFCMVAEPGGLPALLVTIVNKLTVFVVLDDC